MSPSNLHIAFLAHKIFAAGDLLSLAIKIKSDLDKQAAMQLLIFDENTGKQIDIDLRGNKATLEKRFSSPTQTSPDIEPVRKRGRPKLGVIGREVTLLPRHWQWLESQRGGASATIRRLIEQAKKDNQQIDLTRLSQDRTHRFLYAIAGDLPGFEEVIRALFATDELRFKKEMSRWPPDIKQTAIKFAHDAFQ